MMYQPPSAARTDYSPYMRNVALLPAYPDGDVLTGPGSADDDPGVGHRSSRRPGGLRRPHRRPPRETKNAGLDPRPAEYRAPHRAQGAQRAQPAERAEQPGISWGSARPGSAAAINERLGHMSAAPLTPRLLQRMQVFAGRQALHGRDRGVARCDQRQAGVGAPSVDQDGAGTALAPAKPG